MVSYESHQSARRSPASPNRITWQPPVQFLTQIITILQRRTSPSSIAGHGN